MNVETMKQYQQEERTLIAKRLKRANNRVGRLLDAMCKDTLSLPEKVTNLKKELADHYQYAAFLQCNSMGDIMRVSLKLLSDSY